MIDYTEISKPFQGKNKPFLGYLQGKAAYSSGWESYTLQGCKEIDVLINNRLELLKIKGCFPYFIKGHNFCHTKAEFNEAVRFMEDTLEISLFDSTLDCLEHGRIIEVPYRAKEYIKHHHPSKGLRVSEHSRSKGNFKAFERSNYSLKLYDAGRNIQHKQGYTLKEIIKSEGWNPKSNYLKIESHYKKPHLQLNRGQNILLADILSPKWEKKLSENLLYEYQILEKMKSIEHPENKTELSPAAIGIILLAEEWLNQGKSLPQIKRLIYDKINSFDSKILTSSDKDYRKRKVKAVLDNIEVEDKSKWDLSEKLEEVLKG